MQAGALLCSKATWRAALRTRCKTNIPLPLPPPPPTSSSLPKGALDGINGILVLSFIFLWIPHYMHRIRV